MLKTAFTLAAVSAGVLLPAAGAHAWSAGSANGVTTFTAAGDEANKPQLYKLDAAMLRFTDSGGGASASGACGAGNGVANCPIGSLVRVLLGDENDVALVGDAIAGAGAALNLSGGTGKDILSNGKLDGAISGDEGNDTIRPGEGTDAVDGGPGLDIVDYSERSYSIKVQLGQGNAQGAPGETDTLTGIEAAFGGSNDDQITGGAAAEQFVPGDGKDNVLTGGNDDIVHARDGFKDTINCGPGDDTVLTDQLDVPVDCETVAMKHTLMGGGGLKAVPPAPEDLPSESDELPAPGTPGTGSPSGSAPGTTPVGGSSPVLADRTAPRIAKLRLTKPSIRGKQATSLRFTLSEPAAVTIAVERCVPTKRKTKRCALPTRVTSLRRAKLSGAVALKLTRALPERTLKRGRYRLKLVATDAAGNRSSAGTTLLTVR